MRLSRIYLELFRPRSLFSVEANLWQITLGKVKVSLDILQKPSSIIVLLYCMLYVYYSWPYITNWQANYFCEVH